MKIQEAPLTDDLKKRIFEGFTENAIETVGANELGQQVAFTASREGHFAGALVAQIFWGALHIKYVFVEKSYRKKGVATKLMEEALQYGKKNHCSFAFVETMSFQALEFYKKVGFHLDYSRSGFSHHVSFHYLKKPIH